MRHRFSLPQEGGRETSRGLPSPRMQSPSAAVGGARLQSPSGSSPSQQGEECNSASNSKARRARGDAASQHDGGHGCSRPRTATRLLPSSARADSHGESILETAKQGGRCLPTRSESDPFPRTARRELVRRRMARAVPAQEPESLFVGPSSIPAQSPVLNPRPISPISCSN